MNTTNTTSRTARPTRLARLAAVALLLGGVTVGALAQYKIVGPDGKVTYTDKPPTASDIKPSKGTPAPAGSGGLPYETRTAMGKYPVTLYTTKNCPGCDHARSALRTRGVPFTEFTVSTDADFASFQQRFNGLTSPIIVIGNQTMRGYSANDLSGYLDAAGYPPQARLTGYNWPAATPLSPQSTLAPAAGGEAAADASAAASAAAPAPLLPPPSKSGIQF